MMRTRGGTQTQPLLIADVIEAALRVVERGSLEQLTVRAVADECGVTPPAVHYHLRGGDDLSQRVVEAVAARIDIRIDSDDPWTTQYLTLIGNMDQVFLRYPGTGVRALATSGPSNAAKRLTETALEILSRGGFDKDEAIEVFTASFLLFAGWLATRGLAEHGQVHPSLAATGSGRAAGGDDAPLRSALLRLFAASGGKNDSPNDGGTP